MLHQEFTQFNIVVKRCTMQWSPMITYNDEAQNKGLKDKTKKHLVNKSKCVHRVNNQMQAK